VSTTDSPAAAVTPRGPSSGADLAERLAQLPVEKRALLEQLLLAKRRAAGEGPEERIPRRSGAGPWPLSYAQELMWLLDRLTPGGNAYNSPAATRLEGPLDVAALQRSLDALVARTEILRTTYDEVDGSPVQVVHPPAPVPIRVTDLTDLPAAERQVKLDRLLKQEAERPYDLRSDTMLRAMLLRLAPEDHVLLLTVHHIAVDGWSKAVLWRHLTALYDATVEGREPDLPEAPLQYADWAVWHRQWLEGGALDEQVAYWREQLAGVPELLELPTDRPRPAVRTGHGDRRDVLFDRGVLDGLHRIAREESSTLFVVALAAFATLLHRYTAQHDIVVATPIAGRNRVEVEDLVGYFMNTVAIRVDAGGDPTFRELVRRVRERVLGAFAHQEVPFERVVHEVNPTRDLSRTPLCQVMLVLQNQKRTQIAPTRLIATPYRHERDWAKFDLTVGLGERPAGLNTSWEFSTDLFDPPTVERMMRQFGVLLEAVVADPDRPVSAVPLLRPDETRQLAAWESGGPAAANARLHDVVAAAAADAPDAPAVRCDGHTVTAAELDARANRLAHHLQALGVGPERRVAVCLDRSVDLVVGLLGVLKAGGACVPLDPAHPPGRLRRLLEDSDPAVVLTTSERGAELAGGPVVALDADGPAIEARPATPPECAAQPSSAAYVLYTSGSTGTPKGVVLEHRGLANHAIAAARLYRLGRADRVLQFSSTSFDISIEEIFATLGAGGCVVLRPEDLPLGGTALLDWLDRERITVLDLPTAYWHELVGDLEVRGLALPPSLRLVVVGGARASAAAYRGWRRLAGDRVTWVNTYGPTEASVIATAWQPPAGTPNVDGTEIPIGRPIAGVTVRILDGHGRQVPVGVRGELHIGGVGLARGFLNAPDLTAQRFIADPDIPGQRLYRTGDLVRWLPSGDLEFVGRLDAQVKVRGFRVEPAEIEAVLEEHPAVTESVVVTGADPVAGERLVAYAVVRGGPGTGVRAEDARDADATALRRHLADRLPAYMLPATVVPVDQLPLTVNGKVDLSRLPAPDDVQAPVVVEPADDVERELLQIWRAVLGHGAFDRHDSFFDVGGDSLLAVRVFARVEKAFGTALPLATLIAAPTVADLATVLRSERRAETWDPLVPLRSTGSRPPLFVVHELAGDLLYYRDLVRLLPADQPVFGLRSVGLDPRRPAHVRIEDMAAHYLEQVRRVQPGGPYLFAGFCFGGVVAYEMAVQLHARGEQAAFVGLFESSPYGWLGGGETATERARRRLAEFHRADPRRRPGMVPQTLHRIWKRTSRSARWSIATAGYFRSHPIPRWLLGTRMVNWMAAVRYMTPAYAGPVTLFVMAGSGEVSEPRRRRWEQLVGEQLTVCHVGQAGVTHRTVMAPPHVEDLAARLDDVLADAVRRYSRASS
jgi:amino acid adenylation domain-containing protein